ncbi:Tripartite motif-containing protein 29 [Anabarilius grahami]|uniref:Tripartite motif-containing protein 29 n=1 Tax=Anabarilius grahami TaxID=495550 RepID=A0A3N0YY42_ANAGA|nr:Tripartite motif-containing protein 29 [Anabarilius grahami]
MKSIFAKRARKNCSESDGPRPALDENTMLAEEVKNPKKRKLPVDCYIGDGDVLYDVCTGRKHKAVKSCLDSDRQNHHENRESFFKRERHNLTEATGRLQEMICQTHDKVLEVFCRTDQKCICLLCIIDEHKNHDTVSAAGQRKENQKQLKEKQRLFQQRIQQREKDLQQLREAVESHKSSAQTAVEDSERIFTELIRSIERSCSEATQRIRDQEKTAVSRAEERLERLEQEISDLRRRDAELEQLSHTQDHIHFLQSFQSLSSPPESTDVNDDDPFSSLSSFVDVREAVLQFRDKVEDFCKEELKKIFDRVKELLSGESIQDIVHVDGDVASGQSQENQPGESPVVESEHSPNGVTESSSSCVSPPEDPVRETSCDPIVSRLQADGDVNKCTLSTPRRGHKQLREVPGACELPSASRLRTLDDNAQDYEDRGPELCKESQLDVCNADFDEVSSDESDPGPPIERDMSRLSYGMIIECSLSLLDENTFTPVNEQPAVSATETMFQETRKQTAAFSKIIPRRSHPPSADSQLLSAQGATEGQCRLPYSPTKILGTGAGGTGEAFRSNFMKTRASLGIETLDGWTLSSIDVAVQTDWSSCGVFLLMNRHCIREMKSIFARHGIADIVVSDNGPQDASAEFSSFAEEWGFKHVTFSPGYAQSNGQAERAVQTVKNLLKKAQSQCDPYIALLEYRNTPMEGIGLSSAQLLMGRRLRTKLPTSSALLTTETMLQVHEQLEQRQKKQKQYYDRMAKYLPDLQPGEGIRMQKGDSWKPAVVLEKHEQPRSFVVKTPDGKLFRRNRRHLRKTRETDSSTFEKSADMDTDSQQSVDASQSNALDSKDISNERNGNESVEKEQAYRTRSGRIVRIPEKYKD